MRRLFVAAGFVATVLACSANDSTSFDPARYSTACRVDSDCVLADAISNCSICGCRSAITRAAATDYREVLDNCNDQGLARCLVAQSCAETRAYCINSQCSIFFGRPSDEELLDASTH